MSEENQAAEVKEAKKYSRLMTISPFSAEADIDGDFMLQFDATEGQVAKAAETGRPFGRALLVSSDSVNADKQWGEFNLNKSKEDAKEFISIKFNDKSNLKEAVLFKSVGKDGHNFFSGTITTKEGEEQRLTGNLVSVKDSAQEWLGDYTFKKDIQDNQSTDQDPAPGM